MRIGQGYDVHRLVSGRPLIIGGVNIPHYKGLLGHSDADVLTHAIMDALLGAAGEGDIGRHFPDSDSAYKGADSLRLLGCVMEILTKNGFTIGNIDAVIIAQGPRMADHIPEMVKHLADSCNIPQARINVKATTEEGLGFTGSGDGISAMAICLLEEKN